MHRRAADYFAALDTTISLSDCKAIPGTPVFLCQTWTDVTKKSTSSDAHAQTSGYIS